MEETFALRVDIDSMIGLKKGVPKILDLLSHYGVKASFYCLMGWEGRLYPILKHRFLRAGRYSMPRSSIRVLGSSGSLKTDSHELLSGYLEVGRRLISPKKLSNERGLLQRMKDEGHDVGVHGYIHVRWNSLKKDEMEDEFRKMIEEYEGVFDMRPIGFATPLAVYNKNVVEFVEKYEFKCFSHLGGIEIEIPEINGRKCSFVNVPVTMDMPNHYSTILYYTLQGMSEHNATKKTINLIKRKLQEKKLASMYCHPRFEGRGEINILKNVIEFVINNGINIRTYEEIALDYLKKNEEKE